MHKLTDRTVAGFKPRAARYEVFDGDGFGVRVSPRGVKAFVLLYRHGGKARRLTLGRYAAHDPGQDRGDNLALPVLSLADARATAAKARKLLERGLDPGAKAVAQRQAERAAETIAELSREYLDRHARPNKRSAAEDERMLAKDVLPAWGGRKAKDISRRDVIALLDRIVERGAPIQSNRVLACLRRMFNWAIECDLLAANPCAMVKARATENRRERVLNAAEIAAFWHGLDRARMSATIRLALRLQLATAQRKGEVINAEWTEFDLAHKVWTIPGEKAKNGLAHRVPLTPLTLHLLEAIKTNGKDSRWLFPSARGDKPITGPAVDHALRDNRETIGVADATPHDLRRTAASQMASMGIPRLVVSKLLNHAERGVTAVYDRHSYDQEKQQALEVWGRRLEEILALRPAAENVVALRRPG